MEPAESKSAASPTATAAQPAAQATSGAVARRLVRLPMAPLAAALIGGIVLGRYLSLQAGGWAVLGGLALLGAVALARRSDTRGLAMACALVASAAVGACYVRLCCFTVADDHIVYFSSTHRQLATIRGQIITSPQISDAALSAQAGYQRQARTGMVLEATAIQTGERWSPASGLVRVMVNEPALRLAAGQHVELAGWLGRYYGPDNPGQRDAREAARADGVLVRLEVRSADAATVLSGPQGPLRRAYWRVRSAARAHLLSFGDADDGRLVNALVIGERHPALADLNRLMMAAGIAHYLSISGSHLAIFLGFIYLLCRLLAASPRQSAIVVLVVLAAYLALAEYNGPLMRSAVMAAALCVATIAGRQYSAVNALSAAAVVVLALDPMQLFTAGFQLSFGIVLGLAVVYPAVRRAMFGRWLLRRGLMIFRDKQRIRRWLYYRAADGAIAAVAGSVTAFVVSTPLVAYHFGLFSPWAALLSVVLAVPVTLVLVPAYLSMALAWPMPSLSDWLGRLAAAAADGLATMVGWLQHLPALSLDVRPVSAWWVVLCYAVLACVLLRRRLPLGLAASVGLGAILAAVTVVSQLPAAAPGVAEVHVLDVGPGQCVLVRAPSGQSCMIDAGTRSGFDAGELTLRPFLRAMRFGQPRTLFVSHANTDHYNAMLAMLRQGGIHQVCVGEHFAAAAAVGVEAKAFLDAVSRAGAELKVLRRGDVVRLDERTRVEVLGPPPGATIKNVNDTSLVLRLVCDDKSMLFPGDAEDAGQSAAMAEPGALASDVLLMPHHGGWGRRLPEFVAAVRPGWVVVSAAQDPQGPSERAARAFYSRLHSGYRYFSTAHNGWCAISLGGGRVDVQTMR